MAEYAEAMQAGAVFPPLVVFAEGDRFWLAEGFHRVAAYTAAGFTEVPCDVRPGGLRDAILHSAGANADHGVRRTKEDKRRSVLMLLDDEVWCRWSDREIARACAVSHTFVAAVRSSHLATLPDGPRLVERGGTTYPMKPRQRSAGPGPKPSAPAEDEAQGELQPETPVEPTAPYVPADLADALARQYRLEAEQVRGPSAAEGVASNVVPRGRRVWPGRPIDRPAAASSAQQIVQADPKRLGQLPVRVHRAFALPGFDLGEVGLCDTRGLCERAGL